MADPDRRAWRLPPDLQSRLDHLNATDGWPTSDGKFPHEGVNMPAGSAWAMGTSHCLTYLRDGEVSFDEYDSIHVYALINGIGPEYPADVPIAMAGRPLAAWLGPKIEGGRS